MLWREYWAEFGLPEDFQGFGEELRQLPGSYVCVLIAYVNQQLAGAIALRPLDDLRGEAKRLYVRPVFRGCGVASSLLRGIISAARELGYAKLYGDTLPSMSSALALYRRFGFHETGPYSSDPTPSAIYLELPLVS